MIGSLYDWNAIWGGAFLYDVLFIHHWHVRFFPCIYIPNVQNCIMDPLLFVIYSLGHGYSMIIVVRDFSWYLENTTFF